MKRVEENQRQVRRSEDKHLDQYSSPALTLTLLKLIATSIEPGQPEHPCSLIMLYTVGWQYSSSHYDKSLKVIMKNNEMEGGLFHLRNSENLNLTFNP